MLTTKGLPPLAVTANGVAALRGAETLSFYHVVMHARSSVNVLYHVGATVDVRDATAFKNFLVSL